MAYKIESSFVNAQCNIILSTYAAQSLYNDKTNIFLDKIDLRMYDGNISDYKLENHEIELID